MADGERLVRDVVGLSDGGTDDFSMGGGDRIGSPWGKKRVDMDRNTTHLVVLIYSPPPSVSLLVFGCVYYPR